MIAEIRKDHLGAGSSLLRRILRAAALLLLLFLTPSSQAAEQNVNDALRRASEFILRNQDDKGAIFELKAGGQKQTAMTSLAILALTSLGHQPSDASPEGQALKRALAFVLRPEAQESDGYFGDEDGSRMYGHGITALMLAEMLGMGADATQDELIRTKCRKAVELILRAQKVPKNDGNRGGWRYTPDSGDSDMSVTVWQTMALRAAKNAGIDVPKDAIDQAIGYIKRCYDGESDKRGGVPSGGFGYTGKGRDLSTTSEGMLALQVCGEYESTEVLGASERLLREGLRPGEKWFYYLSYYYAQGMYQRGGKHAETGKRVVAETLLPLQHGDGFWEGRGSEEKQGGKIYATSLAVLSLAVKNHFLPIYQR